MSEMKKEKTNLIEKLFLKWRQRQNEESDEEYKKYGTGEIPKNAFLPDGIVDEAQFAQKKQAGKAVMFVAKEANWYNDDTDKENCETAAGDASFWVRDVAFHDVPETMFSKRLSMLVNAYDNNDYETVNKNHIHLQSCAFINLNKRGGLPFCRWEALEGYTAKYAAYIEKEIKLIQPDLIICCGDGVKWLLEKYHITDDIEAKVISVYHPSYFALSDVEYLKQFQCSLTGKEWVYQKRTAENRTENDAEESPKGIMFDTNKTYFDTATFDMLTDGKISAYDDACKYLRSFRIGDIVFYYVKGKGVVAAGEVCSDIKECQYHGSIENYRTVKRLVPKEVPTEEKLKGISPSEIKALFGGKGFYWASTVKTPFLRGDEPNVLLRKLKELYCEEKG